MMLRRVTTQRPRQADVTTGAWLADAFGNRIRWLSSYFLCGGVRNGDGVADVVFLSFLGFLISRLLFF
jgi:hypothetical protein